MRQRTVNLGFINFLLGIALIGCSVGPHYRQPVVDAPASWLGAAYQAASSRHNGDEIKLEQNQKPIVAWWTTFGDPMLEGYLVRSVQHNLDIRVARARVREARALRAIAASHFAPDIGSDTSYQRFRTSENSFGTGQLAQVGLVNPEDDLFSVGLDASWEIDVFGRTRRAVEASQARLEAQIAHRHDILTSVLAEAALNYIELRSTQKRLTVANKNIRIQSDTLTFAQNRLQAGLGSQLDVSRARGQLRTTQASVPPLRAAIRASAYRLAVLTGTLPGAVVEELLASQPLPIPREIVPVGLPSDLLRRRPDLRQAERELAAATADIGLATAELYPRFSLTGVFSLDSISASDFLTGASRAWSVGPSVRWPLFQGGRLRANIHAAEARQDVALAHYEQAVLSAFADVESALVHYTEEQQERQRLQDATEASMQSVELATVLYERGLADFLTVLDAERRLTEVEDRLVRSETHVMTRLIRLYKALGGGWEPFEQEYNL